MTKYVAGLILLIGLAIRIPGISEPLFGFHPTRQYRSAIIARGLALDSLDVSSAQREGARTAAAQQGAIEPPLFEHAAALAYRLAGGEDLRLPRALGVMAWMVGSLALWGLARALWPRAAATLAALAVFLFLPFGIPASQAFQPDGPMVAAMVAALACLVRWADRPTAGTALLAVLASAAAIFVKPMGGFFIFPAAFALAVHRAGWWRGLGLTAGLCALAILPATAWYVLFAPSAGEARMFPQLLRTAAYWTDWLKMIDAVVWWPVALAAAAGAMLAQDRARALIVALWAGYVAFGLVFTHHIHTHNYYSLPLIPIAALSIGALVDRVDRAVAARPARRIAAIVLAVLVCAGLGASLTAAGVLRAPEDARMRESDFQRIGAIVRPGARVVALDGDYGYPLNYHAWVSATNWPLSIDRAMAVLSGHPLPPPADALGSLDADFFVATVQSELDGFGDLHQLLEDRYPLAYRAGQADRWRVIVFDLRHPKFSLKPAKLSLFTVADGSAASLTRVALWTPKDIAWRAADPSGLVEIQPSHGTGPAEIVLSTAHVVAGLDRTIDVQFSAEGAATVSGTLTVRVRSLAARPSTLPMGSVDGPGEPVLTGGPVTFQGWALDALDLRRVRVEAVDATGRTRTLGETRGTWMRNDVAAVYPDAHDIFNCAWAFTMEPTMIAGLAHPMTLHFYGETGDGRRAEIGKRTVRDR